MDHGERKGDPLLDATARVSAARRSDKDALWIAGAAAGLTFLLLGEAAAEGWAILVIVAAGGLAYRISKIVLYRVRGLGWLPLFGDLLPETVSPQQPQPANADAPATVSAPEPRSALVPRLAFAQTWPASWIVVSETAGVTTLRGGRPDTDYRDLPLGVLLLTERGLAFLPEARGMLEERLGEIPAAVLTKVAGTLFEPIEFVESWKDRMEAMAPPPTLADWMAKALAQKHAFAISWGDLTGVMVGRTHTVLTRETADGTREDFVILDASAWPGVLMQKRIVADLRDAMRVKVLKPKIDELLPTVRTQLADRGEEEIGEEALRRAMVWLNETPPAQNEQTVKDAMAPVLEDYSIFPNIVANQPWLFEEKK